MRHEGSKLIGSRTPVHTVRALMGAIILGALAAAAVAQDPCDRLLRKLIDDMPEGHPAERINGGLETLAELEKLPDVGEQAIRNVDSVVATSRTEDTPKVLDELLGKRSTEEARAVFDTAASFEEKGRRGVTKGAGLSSDIDPGARVHEVLSAAGNRVTAERKQRYFEAIDELISEGGPLPGVDQTDGLFNRAAKAAGRNNDVGGMYEAYGSVELQRRGRHGTLQHVDFDRGGAGSATGERIVDTLTDTHTVQFKHKQDAPELVLGSAGIKDEDLVLLMQETHGLGRESTLIVSNVPASDALRTRLQELATEYNLTVGFEQVAF